MLMQILYLQLLQVRQNLGENKIWELIEKLLK